MYNICITFALHLNDIFTTFRQYTHIIFYDICKRYVQYFHKICTTRLISIVSKPIKLICGQTNFDEKLSKKIWVKKVFGQKKALGWKNIWV